MKSAGVVPKASQESGMSHSICRNATIKVAIFPYKVDVICYCCHRQVANNVPWLLAKARDKPCKLDGHVNPQYKG
jgi:hypothetical protein